MKKALEKKWEIYNPVPEEISTGLKEYPEIIRQILYNRDIFDLEAARNFLYGEEMISDPFLLGDMEQAVVTIMSALQHKRRILIFGDYDADGVTATALLYLGLNKIFEHIHETETPPFEESILKYIPNRFDEGYGFSEAALEEVKKLNPDLLITVDCGVRSVDEVSSAKSVGMDVIITDHHQPFHILPKADAIICPKKPGETYPYKELSGVGIAYKLICALNKRLDENAINPDEWLDFVAIGTIADLTPLTGENRWLVKEGLQLIRTGHRPGINALAKVSSLNPYSLKARDIGFMIAPRLNAAGRLASADTAFNILIESNLEKANELAAMLDNNNRLRQSITKEIINKVETYFEKEDHAWFLFYANEAFNEGVVGLAASRLVENYYRPAVIGSINGDYIRASCRSINELNITNALDACADLLEKHGGHAMAAGLTIRKDLSGEFITRMNEVIETKLFDKDLIPVISAEMEVELPQLHPSLLDYFHALEPFGEGNPIPLFISRNLEVVNPRAMGADGEHLKINVRNSVSKTTKQRITFSCVCFNFGWMKDSINTGDSIDILFSYEINEYNGKKELQLRIVDIKPSNGEAE